MPEVLLNRSRVVAVVGQFVAGRTAEHVRMNRELKAGLASGPGDDLSNRVRGQRSLALADEDIGSARLLPL